MTTRAPSTAEDFLGGADLELLRALEVTPRSHPVYAALLRAQEAIREAEALVAKEDAPWARWQGEYS